MNTIELDKNGSQKRTKKKIRKCNKSNSRRIKLLKSNLENRSRCQKPKKICENDCTQTHEIDDHANFIENYKRFIQIHLDYLEFTKDIYKQEQNHTIGDSLDIEQHKAKTKTVNKSNKNLTKQNKKASVTIFPPVFCAAGCSDSAVTTGSLQKQVTNSDLHLMRLSGGKSKKASLNSDNKQIEPIVTKVKNDAQLQINDPTAAILAKNLQTKNAKRKYISVLKSVKNKRKILKNKRNKKEELLGATDLIKISSTFSGSTDSFRLFQNEFHKTPDRHLPEVRRAIMDKIVNLLVYPRKEARQSVTKKGRLSTASRQVHSTFPSEKILSRDQNLSVVVSLKSTTRFPHIDHATSIRDKFKKHTGFIPVLHASYCRTNPDELKKISSKKNMKKVEKEYDKPNHRSNSDLNEKQNKSELLLTLSKLLLHHNQKQNNLSSVISLDKVISQKSSKIKVNNKQLAKEHGNIIERSLFKINPNGQLETNLQSKTSRTKIERTVEQNDKDKEKSEKNNAIRGISFVKTADPQQIPECPCCICNALNRKEVVKELSVIRQKDAELSKPKGCDAPMKYPEHNRNRYIPLVFSAISIEKISPEYNNLETKSCMVYIAPVSSNPVVDKFTPMYNHSRSTYRSVYISPLLSKISINEIASQCGNLETKSRMALSPKISYNKITSECSRLGIRSIKIPNETQNSFINSFTFPLPNNIVLRKFCSNILLPESNILKDKIWISKCRRLIL